MLRWLIPVLILANLLMLAVAHGAFGPLPAAGAREPHHLLLQVRPESLSTRAAESRRCRRSGDRRRAGARRTRPGVAARPISKNNKRRRRQDCARTFFRSAVVERSCSNAIASALPPQPRTSADSASVSMS